MVLNFRSNMDNWIPGLIDNSVLYDQKNHVSEDVWASKDRGKLTTSQLTAIIYELWNLTKAQKILLHKCGFGIFTHLIVITKTDISLVSTLVNRWRSETNTFHL